MNSADTFKEHLPQLLVLLSGIGYCIQGLGLKLLTNSFHTIIVYIFFKGILQFIIIFIVILVHTQGFTCHLSLFSLNKNLVSILLIRCVLGFAGACMSFNACQLLPLGESAALFLTSPMFATIGAVIFLGETINRKEFCTMLLGFLGIGLIILPPLLSSNVSMNGNEIRGLHFALFTTLTSAVSYLTLRMMGTTVQASWMLIGLASAIGQIICGFVTLIIIHVVLGKDSKQ